MTTLRGLVLNAVSKSLITTECQDCGEHNALETRAATNRGSPTESRWAIETKGTFEQAPRGGAGSPG
jgi:hypothetical protein